MSRVTEFVKGGDRIQARFLWLRDMCAYLPTKICLFFFKVLFMHLTEKRRKSAHKQGERQAGG